VSKKSAGAFHEPTLAALELTEKLVAGNLVANATKFTKRGRGRPTSGVTKARKQAATVHRRLRGQAARHSNTPPGCPKSSGYFSDAKAGRSGWSAEKLFPVSAREAVPQMFDIERRVRVVPDLSVRRNPVIAVEPPPTFCFEQAKFQLLRFGIRDRDA
jgi:hypothetical protein